MLKRVSERLSRASSAAGGALLDMQLVNTGDGGLNHKYGLALYWLPQARVPTSQTTCVGRSICCLAARCLDTLWTATAGALPCTTQVVLPWLRYSAQVWR
jgi:hypothetical protein